MRDIKKHLEETEITECISNRREWQKSHPEEWDHIMTCETCWAHCLDRAKTVGDLRRSERQARLTRNAAKN